MGGVQFQVGSETIAFILIALAAAAMVSFLLTPIAMRIAASMGAIDEPDAARRVHDIPIPRLGGLAVATTFVVVGVGAVLVADGRTLANGAPVIARPIQEGELNALFLGVLLAMLFGSIDDRWQIRARWQLLGQLLLAVVAVLGGIAFTQIANPFQFLGDAFGGQSLQFLYPEYSIRVADRTIYLVPALLTALWIVGMVNSINWIDGLDGLSTGVSLVAAVTLALISITALPSEPMVSLLCAVLAGSLAGFLPWNFHPARIFIGTAGVMAVGYALAVLSILGTAKVAVALLVLGVPIIDTFWIIIRRVAAGSSPFEPDRGHLHHRLLDLGLTHRGAVLLIYAMSVALGMSAVVLASGAGPLYAFVGVVIAGGFLLYLLTRRTQDSLDARSYPRDPPDGPAPGQASSQDLGAPGLGTATPDDKPSPGSRADILHTP